MANEDTQQPKEQPKIVVDEDWKAQAEAEKERLAEQEKAAPPGAAAGAAGARPRELPTASFTTLVTSLVTQVLFALGAVQDHRGRRYHDLGLAKHHIDTLAMLEEKTAGNLTAEEKKTLDNALYEARMAYVQAAQGGA